MSHLNHPTMQPVRDPLRSLIYAAAERAVRDVYVDGVKVVDHGEVLTLDYEGSSQKLQGVLQSIEQMAPQMDWKNRSSEEIAPLTLSHAVNQ